MGTAGKGDEIRQEADREVDELTYMFKNAQSFFKQVITTMLDEPSTREALNKVTVALTALYPFILFNENRLANATNSLVRAETTKHMI